MNICLDLDDVVIEQTLQLNDTETENYFKNLEPIQGALEGIVSLQDKGHRIHIITSREGQTKAYAVKWLEKYRVKYNSISFTRNKSTTAYFMNIDIAVDDSIRHVQNYQALGIKSLLFYNQHNRMFEETGHRLITRVKDWDEVLDILNGHTNKK